MKKIISMLIILCITVQPVLSEESGSELPEKKIENTGMSFIRMLLEQKDNSDLQVRVYKAAEATQELFYTGELGGFQNGKFACYISDNRQCRESY